MILTHTPHHTPHTTQKVGALATLDAVLFITRKTTGRHLASPRAARTAIALAVAWTLFAAALGLAAAAADPTVVRVEVRVPGLRSELDGVRLVQLSDVHVGQTVGRRRVARAVSIARQVCFGVGSFGLRGSKFIRSRGGDGGGGGGGGGGGAAVRPCVAFALTGDIVDGAVRDMELAMAPLALLSHPLRAEGGGEGGAKDGTEGRAKDGAAAGVGASKTAAPVSGFAPAVLYVTGNHEHIHGELGDTMSALERLGIHVLRNERIRVPVPRSSTGDGDGGGPTRTGAAVAGTTLLVAGVFDINAGRFDGGAYRGNMTAALGGLSPGDNAVLLAHQPNDAPAAAAFPGVALQLSGHTHAGQFPPLQFGAWLLNSHFSGLYSRRRKGGGSMSVYVSAGTHWWGPAIRLTPRPHEITEVTLVREAG